MPSTSRSAVVGLVAGLSLLAACGGGGPSVAEERADQVRETATEAGLPDDVADVLALAARGQVATFQVGYAGTGGARILVSQRPPDHRVDVIAAGRVVESRVLRDGTAYTCEPDAAAGADDGALRCSRAAGSLRTMGSFTDEALGDFARQLAAGLEDHDLGVDERTIADTEVTCLVSSPKAGRPSDGTAGSADTLCVSAEGAQLLIDAGGERLVADSYTTEVPTGTFDV